MYESPMDKIFGEITEELNRQDEENCMVSIRQAVGYQVDKEELIKALQYDRDQYRKGYNDALDKIRAEIEQIIGEHNLDDYDFCSGLICARKIIDKYKESEE